MKVEINNDVWEKTHFAFVRQKHITSIQSSMPIFRNNEPVTWLADNIAMNIGKHGLKTQLQPPQN